MLVRHSAALPRRRCAGAAPSGPPAARRRDPADRSSSSPTPATGSAATTRRSFAPRASTSSRSRRRRAQRATAELLPSRRARPDGAVRRPGRRRSTAGSHGRRQPDRDAAGHQARRAARARRRRRRRGRRLHRRRHELGARAPASPARRCSSTASPTGWASRARAGRRAPRDANTAALGAAVTAAQRRRRRRPGRGVHVRPRALGRLHAPGQPRLGRRRARRHLADPLQRPLLRRRPTTGSTSTRSAIPQADEQQRLLANLIIQMNLDRTPLPALLVPAARREGGGRDDRRRPRRTAAPGPRPLRPLRRDDPPRLLRRGLGVRARRHRTSIPSTPIPGAAGYQAAGFEIALHLSTSCSNFTPAVDRRRLERPARRFGARSSRPSPARGRTGRTASPGAIGSSEATAARAHGVRLDTNYYYWPGIVGQRAGRACSPARGSRSGSPTPTAR